MILSRDYFQEFSDRFLEDLIFGFSCFQDDPNFPAPPSNPEIENEHFLNL